MTSDRQLGESISRWMAESAPPRVPDRVLAATFERTRGRRQQAGWRARFGPAGLSRSVVALTGAAIVVVGVGIALGLLARQPQIAGPSPSELPATDPRSSFVGVWIAAQDDGSTQKLTIRPEGIGAVRIVVVDDRSILCAGSISTLIGIGGIERSGSLLIRTPAVTCDDGSQPKAPSGPPLDQQLRDLTFFMQGVTLFDTLGGVWAREGAPQPTGEPARVVWPQTSLEEAREAQRLADAGDARYTWQVEPALAGFQLEGVAEIHARFLREVMGWEAFRRVDSGESGGFLWDGFIRCAPGRSNPLYPSDPDGGDCAPTIDELRYERVRIEISQPVRRDATGIWVVRRWAMIEPFEQVVPPSEAASRAAVDAFVRARIEGTGAEQYVEVPDVRSPSLAVPLLYMTTAGAAFERAEFDLRDTWSWPDGGARRVTVQLFADAGATVVEQRFLLSPDSPGRFHLLYDPNPEDEAPTTENGEPVPVEYRFASGAVRFQAAWPWDRNPDWGPQGPNLVTLAARASERLAVVAEPRSIGLACKEREAPADAAALAHSIREDPDHLATAPVAATIGGLPALQMDVEAPSTNSWCEPYGGALVVTGAILDEGSRMRLWLVDLPGPFPRIVAIAFTAPKPEFERALVEQLAPILETLEVRAR